MNLHKVSRAKELSAISILLLNKVETSERSRVKADGAARAADITDHH